MMTKRQVSTTVVIPNWNGEELLKNCLPSLKRQTFNDLEVIVVDNGSTDNSVKFIKKNFPEVRIISLDKNYGFAKAVNAGIRQSRGKYIFLLNNDTELDKTCLQHLVNCLRDDPSMSFAVAKMLNFYKRKFVDNAGDRIDCVGHLIVQGRGEKDSPKFNLPKSAFLACGGGCLIKREVVEAIGLFDEDFVTYMEDADLFFRAQLQGFTGKYEPKAIIYHIRMATSSKNQRLVDYLVFKNMMMTVIKNFPKALLLKDYNWLKIILVNLNTFRYLAFKGYFWPALKAEGYILINLPKLLKKRALIQKNKKVSDEYIIANVLPKKFTLAHRAHPVR